ncbi:CPXCG motif-containing cysteine-rich protein [Gilvimarinus xylanilyticus]|uniref:CPXCG motif-containing cysteine-rich protein n=1 Tax=Gilvimarinus xylanilyticus TaxID=2944139 RepID=A0A9X2HZF1_9GAMM|nr:CPXCG motif-containing cysteine-rich protein [Gilvimarinus xylanilyticus]MCP8899919.1 CPXCG motif-containing cysteine-rich protein [Gilvimarinus xylanilyticus]
MSDLAERAVACPFCDAHLTLLIDESAGDQSYTEDCHVCCQPILVHVHYDFDGDFNVTVEQE